MTEGTMTAPDTTFETRDGRLWTARFTDATERDVLDWLGFRLAHLAALGWDGLFELFRSHSEVLTGLLWLSALEQLEARRVDPRTFNELFALEHFVGATAALRRAIAARCPNTALAADLSPRR